MIELNPEYAEMAASRLKGDGGMFAEVEARAALIVAAVNLVTKKDGGRDG